MTHPPASSFPEIPTWLERLQALPPGAMPMECSLPEDGASRVAWLAAVCAEAVRKGMRLRVLVADDAWLPDLSNALDLAIRPLCLVVPAAAFTAHITLRATISLLRSRLTRQSDDGWHDAWRAQLAWLESHAESWQTAQDWSAGESAAPWPADVAGLFPISITPVAQAPCLWQDAPAFAVVFDGMPIPDAVEALLSQARVLLITRPVATAAQGGALILADADLQAQQELDAVTAEIAELELELATVQGELAEFTHRYHELIGCRITRLDELQAELALRIAAQAPRNATAQADAEAAQERAQQSREEEDRYRRATADQGEPPPFRPDADIRKLFRQVAQRIHPDRARDESDRNWRNQLMAEANRAYRAGDAHTLQEVMALWAEGNPLSAATTNGSSRVEMQLQRMQSRLAEIQRELNRLFGSRLYELFLAERMARKQGRALLDEMASKLDAQIAAVEARLATIEPAPTTHTPPMEEPQP